MKEKIIKTIGIIILILFVGYIVFEEIKSNRETTKFCKEQCEYLPNEKQWRLDLRAVFEKNGINEWASNMELVKFFPEKDLDKCVKYCKKAGEYLQNLLYPPERERY